MAFARHNGVVRTKELGAIGIPRCYLARMCEEGLLEKVSYGQLKQVHLCRGMRANGLEVEALSGQNLSLARELRFQPSVGTQDFVQAPEQPKARAGEGT